MAYSWRAFDETPETAALHYTQTGREVRHKHERYGKDHRMTVIQIDVLKATGASSKSGQAV